MPPGRRLGTSCWTCRLRRKRCDSARPVCASCNDLGIRCYSDRTKPLWMDGGSQQRQMADTIKEEIKQNAFVKREMRSLNREHQMVMTATKSASATMTQPLLYTGGVGVDGGNDTLLPSSIPSILSLTSTRPLEPQSSHGLNEGSQPLNGGLSATGIAEPVPLELGSLMIYLDHVFPFLFPFYQPSLMETGRQWLLGQLFQNEASFHIAASLSAYFFTLNPQDDEQKMHEACKALVLDRLNQQMDLALKSMQSTISATKHETRLLPLQGARLIQDIVQLLIVELTVRSEAEWIIHLDPALALFNDLFNDHGLQKSEPSLAVLLAALPSLIPPTPPHHKALPYTAEQSALMFFVSILLFIDIIASTSLRKRPTLQHYHSNLLSAHGEEKCQIRLDTIVGCQNWVLVAIGSISDLCASKHDARGNDHFSTANLISLATPICETLDHGLHRLEYESSNGRSEQKKASQLGGYYSRFTKTVDQQCISNITQIWAHAAKIYLFVSLWGWQTNSVNVQASVSRIMSLLQLVEHPAQMRSLSWPITVAGCFASSSQEDIFRSIVENMGQLADFGTMRHGLRIMQNVWASRDTIDESVQDVASVLTVLGTPTLLF